MPDKLFDEFIRQRLTDHSADVPNDMWQRIQSERKKRRVLGWWKTPFGMLLIGALLLGGGYAIYQNTEAEKSKALAEVDGSTTGILNKSDSQVGGDNDINSDLDKQQTTQTGDNYDANDVAGNTNDSNMLQNNTQPEAANGSVASEQKISRQYTRKQSLNSSSATNGFDVTNSNTTSKINRSVNDQSYFSKAKEYPVIEGDVDKGKFAAAFNHTIYNSLGEIAYDKKKLTKSSSLEKLLKDWKFNGFTECPSAYGAGRNDWYLEGFVSPDYSFKSTTKGNLPASYFVLKDSTEHFQSAFTAGIRLSKNIGENLMIKSGLQYSQINEKFSYRSENERRLITVVTIRTIIRSPGDTLTVTDTSTVEQIGYRVVKNQNRYRSIDVPVILGYEWGNEKWKGSINAGVILNIRSWQRGEMLDTSYTPVSFDKSNTQTFKQNIGLGLYGSFSIIKPISDRFDIFAEPYFRYNISNMTKSKSLIDQRFHSAGINFGVRYKLNNTGQH